MLSGHFCYENLPPEGRNDPARPEGRLKDSISCWFRRNRAGHQVPSPVLSGVSGNHVLMHINPTTTPIDNFHSPTLPQKLSRRALLKAIILLYVLYCRLAGTICGSTGEQNQFYARAHSGKKSRSCAVHLYFTMLSCLLHLVFIHRGARM